MATNIKKNRIDSELSSMSLMMQVMSRAKSLTEVSDIIKKFNTTDTYETVHLGVCKINGVYVRNTIHNCRINGLGISINDIDEELNWALCQEAEYLLRPFDLLSHNFKDTQPSKLKAFRETAALLGLKQLIVIPFQVKTVILVTILNFPNADFEERSTEILPQFYQLGLIILENFPTLLICPRDYKLTSREVEILSLSALGLTEASIAKECGISINTVRSHVENSKIKLNARNKLHAVMIALENHEIGINPTPNLAHSDV